VRTVYFFKIIPGLKHLCLSVLILSYLTGSLQIDSIHRLIHGHENSVAHTEESEKNACHRTVFHQATQNTCDHPTHISELKKCPWCNGSLQLKFALTGIFNSLTVFSCEQPFTAFSQNHSEFNLSGFPNRGPPADYF